MTDYATIRLAHGEDPISALRKAHKDQLLLCDRLEEIADSLPDAINRQKCIYAARALGPMIRGVHRFEEEVVFPLIAERLGAAAQARAAAFTWDRTIPRLLAR